MEIRRSTTVLSHQWDFLYRWDDIFIMNQGPGLDHQKRISDFLYYYRSPCQCKPSYNEKQKMSWIFGVERQACSFACQYLRAMWYGTYEPMKICFIAGRFEWISQRTTSARVCAVTNIAASTSDISYYKNLAISVYPCTIGNSGVIDKYSIRL